MKRVMRGDAFIPSIAFPQMQLSRGFRESKIDKKITALTELSAAPDVTDLLHVIDAPQPNSRQQENDIQHPLWCERPDFDSCEDGCWNSGCFDPAFRQNLVTSTQTGALTRTDARLLVRLFTLSRFFRRS